MLGRKTCECHPPAQASPFIEGNAAAAPPRSEEGASQRPGEGPAVAGLAAAKAAEATANATRVRNVRARAAAEERKGRDAFLAFALAAHSRELEAWAHGEHAREGGGGGGGDVRGATVAVIPYFGCGCVEENSLSRLFLEVGESRCERSLRASLENSLAAVP